MAVRTQQLQTIRSRHHVSALEERICLLFRPTRLHPHPTVGLPILLRPSIAHSFKYANINAFPIDYALQPRLRGRLTLGRLPLPRKPWVYGERVFHPFYRYSCQHNHFSTVHHTLTRQLLPVENAPLPITWIPKLRHHT